MRRHALEEEERHVQALVLRDRGQEPQGRAVGDGVEDGKTGERDDPGHDRQGGSLGVMIKKRQGQHQGRRAERNVLQGLHDEDQGPFFLVGPEQKEGEAEDEPQSERARRDREVVFVMRVPHAPLVAVELAEDVRRPREEGRPSIQG